jgi:hypothetical protein
MWAPPRRGEQVKVPITRQNAKRVLFGTINPRTGHRVLLRRSQMRQADFQEFLRLLLRRYGSRPLHLLLDKAPCHDTKGSQSLAVRLRITLVWLPKQCSGLDAIDHLWRPVKGEASANWRWKTVDQHADRAEEWVLGLSDREALRKAGILSEDFWLRQL